MKPPAMKLYGYWRSSCSYRVRIALAHKGLSVEHAAVHLVKDGGQQHAADFTQKNPMGQVPVLEIEGDGGPIRLGQSVAILEYLEEAHPEPALLPSDAVLRARARQLTEIVNAGIQPLQNLRVMQLLERQHGVDAKAWARGHILSGLLAFQAVAESVAGRYCVGDAVSFADCALVPQLYNARRFGIDVEAELPLLHRVDTACAALEAFQAAHPDRQPDAQPS